MDTEQLIRHLHEELAAVPQAQGSFEIIERRGRRRRRMRRSAIAATAVGVMAMTVLTIAWLAPSGPRFQEATTNEPAQVSIDGDVTLPVGDTSIVTDFKGDSLTVYRGLPAPTPQFDPSVLGDEQPLVRAQPQWATNQRVGGVSSVVYIGDVNGRSVFVHTNTVSLLDRIRNWFQEDTLGDSINLTVGDMTTIGGGGVGSGGPFPETGGFVLAGYLVRDPDGPVSDFISWIAVPDDTSVVAIELDDGRRFWQQPNGTTVFFDLEGPYNGEVVLTAVDSSGETLLQHDRQLRGFQQMLDDLPSN